MTDNKTHYKKLMNPNYLGAYSLTPGQDMVLTIKEVKNEIVVGAEGKKEKCVVVYWKENQKPMILNKTNAKIITKLYGTPFIEEWSGHRVQLTATNVKAFGEMVEALRIAPIKNPKAAPTLDKIEKCVDCQKEIQGYKNMTAQQVGIYTNRKYGKTVCVECGKKLKELDAENLPEKQIEDLTNEILGGEQE